MGAMRAPQLKLRHWVWIEFLRIFKRINLHFTVGVQAPQSLDQGLDDLESLKIFSHRVLNRVKPL